AASAGYLTFRNDTDKTIVIQETVIQNGQLKRLKPVRLLPGESIKQYEGTAGAKTYEVYDAQSPNRPLYTANLRVTEANQLFSVSADAKGIALREVVNASGKKP
ncbi:MAG TPA: hypothetical protein VKE74_20105, partial [Gemmataceae bacterium]|nr:hypothetical protein [Gemmataceae bacterium]